MNIKYYLRCLKLVLLVWIACVSTFLGILVPLLLTHRNSDIPDEVANLEYNADYYLTLRKFKINPINRQYLLEPNDAACVGSSPSPYLLILIPSIPDHFSTREAIRKTYGSFADNSLYRTGASGKLNVSISVIFMLGKVESRFNASLVQSEHAIYGDILQADFDDTYANLTLKMLLGIKWISTRCKDVEYLLKIDEDVFVNLPRLVSLLRNQTFIEKGYIFGKIHYNRPVFRDGRWAVSIKDFPLTLYPSYAAGNSYVISGRILPKIFNKSEYLPYLSIEDAFITGCLGDAVGAKKVSVKGFTWWDENTPDPCSFYETGKYTGNRVSIMHMYTLWAAYVSRETLCKTHRRVFIQLGLKAALDSLKTQTKVWQHN